jgi:sodium/hydrogen antiporter
VDSWSLAIVAALLLGYAGLSRRLEKTVLTAPMLFVGAGLLFGTEGLGWLGLGIESGGVRTLAEATLTLVLFADASRIDLGALRREVALPACLLGIGLPLTIAAGTVIAAVLFAQLTWLEALVLAIVLAPTDAALGQARRLLLKRRPSPPSASERPDTVAAPSSSS